jgi:ABC-type phosphate transport system substrate-binding protein
VKNVLKSPEPEELKNYKKRFSSQFKKWNDLKKNKETFNAIRDTLASDQSGTTPDEYFLFRLR